MSQETFAKIADAIAAQLEKGVRPWARPWRSGVGPVAFDMPHNIAGRNYRGGNVPYLWAVAAERGYHHPVWLTFKQAQASGGSVRKGERGSTVFFWNFTKKIEGGVEKTVVWAKAYAVFNIAQCDGITLPSRAVHDLPLVERLAAADELIDRTGAVICHGGDSAYYSPARDVIQLPVAQAFVDIEAYYGTAFHELGHWTGHESRLKREFKGRFGDPAYAYEELVAELTAAFCCASVGIASYEREDHAAYLASWLKAIKDDPKAFISACGKAQAAADLILAAKASDETLAEAA